MKSGPLCFLFLGFVYVCGFRGTLRLRSVGFKTLSSFAALWRKHTK